MCYGDLNIIVEGSSTRALDIYRLYIDIITVDLLKMLIIVYV